MSTDIVTEMSHLLRRGRLADLYARAERINSPMAAILRARALIMQGFAAGPDPKGASAEAILKKLEHDPDGDVALLAQIEMVNAHYIGTIVGDSRLPAIHEAVALGKRAPGRPGVQTSVLFLAGYLAGQLALRARRFDIAREELQKTEKLARSKSDGAMLAQAETAFGRLSAWQGRADLAAGQIARAIAYWDSQENALMAAHARHELAIVHTHRRDWRLAIEELKIVIAAYEANAVHKGYLDRARQALGNALLGAKDLVEAGPLLESLRGAKDPYRAALIQRDLARFNLALAESAVGSEAKALIEKAHKEWEVGRDLVKDMPPDDFIVLSLRTVEGQLIAADPALMGAESAAVGADVLARVAEHFSAPAQTSKKIGELHGLAQVDRPNEIGARIGAIKAYLAAGKAAPGAAKSLHAAALVEAARLREAAAAIDLRLDEETLSLVSQTEELAGRGRDPSDGAAPMLAGAEESLLTFMRREIPEHERLEILARLAADLERLYGMGVKPCGFGPGDVVIRAPNVPVIKTFEGPAAPLRPERAAERAFMAPELFRPHAEIDLRADLYVIGVLLIAWFGEDPPANKGLWLSLARAWRRPLRKRGALLSDLALELTALKPGNRPESASIAADRLHQAAVRLASARAMA